MHDIIDTLAETTFSIAAIAVRHQDEALADEVERLVMLVHAARARLEGATLQPVQ